MKRKRRNTFRGTNVAENARERLQQAVFCCLMDLCDDKYLHKRCIPETRVFVVITSLRDDYLLCNSVPKTRSARPTDIRIGNIFSRTCLLYIVLLVVVRDIKYV